MAILTRPSNGQTIDAAHVDQFVDLNNGGQVYDVAGIYGGPGNANDATNINLALTAAGSSGGQVFLKSGQWNIGTTLSIANDNVGLVGCGWGTVLKANSGFAGPLVATTQGATTVRLGTVIRDMKFDCSIAGAASHCIDLWGTYYAGLTNLWIFTPQALGLYVDRAVGSTLPAAYNEFRNVHITNGKVIGFQSGGGANSGSEFNKWFGGSIEWCGGNGSGNTAGIGVNGLGNFDEFHGLSMDANDTNVLLTQVRGYRFVGCTVDRAFKNLIRVVGGDNHRFVQLKGGDFVAGVLANHTQSAIELDTGTHDNWFSGFILDASNTNDWLNAIREFSGVGPNFFGGIDTKGVPMNLWVRANLLPDCRFDATNKPTVANGAAVGTSPPAATNTGTNYAGQVLLGTGTATAAGKLCTVTFSGGGAGPFSGLPIISLTPASAGGTVKTASLGLSARNQTVTTFDIFCETGPTISQAAGTYIINYTADWANNA